MTDMSDSDLYAIVTLSAEIYSSHYESWPRDLQPGAIKTKAGELSSFWEKLGNSLGSQRARLEAQYENIAQSEMRSVWSERRKYNVRITDAPAVWQRTLYRKFLDDTHQQILQHSQECHRLEGLKNRYCGLGRVWMWMTSIASVGHARLSYYYDYYRHRR